MNSSFHLQKNTTKDKFANKWKIYLRYRSDPVTSHHSIQIAHENTGPNSTLTNHQRQPTNGRTPANDTNSILFAVVALFLFCHIIRIVIFLFSASIKELIGNCTKIYAEANDDCKNNNGTNLSPYEIPEVNMPPRGLWYIGTLASPMLCINSSLNYYVCTIQVWYQIKEMNSHLCPTWIVCKFLLFPWALLLLFLPRVAPDPEEVLFELFFDFVCLYCWQ